MFSIHDEPIYAERALGAGACGHVSKASAPELLVEAIHTVARGEIFVSSDVAPALNGQSWQRIEDAIGALSPRELEITQLLVDGLSVTEVAERLGLKYKTVANCQTAIRRKLAAPTPTHLQQIAARCRLLAPSP
jgi:two-component system invasion response regulator UvrY